MKKLICSFLVGFVIFATGGLANATLIDFNDVTYGAYPTGLGFDSTGAYTSDPTLYEVEITADSGTVYATGTALQGGTIGDPSTEYRATFYGLEITSFTITGAGTGGTIGPITVDGTNSSVTFTADVWCYNWDNLEYTYDTTGGGDDPPEGEGTIDIVTNPVPEPATMLLLGAGLIGLAGARRFKK